MKPSKQKKNISSLYLAKATLINKWREFRAYIIIEKKNNKNDKLERS